MAERIVLDASIAIPLVTKEPSRPAVRALAGRWTDRGVELIVPAHFWLEVTNVLGRRYRRSAEGMVEELVLLDSLGLRTIDADRPLLLLAIDAMTRYDLSAYDAIYFALAASIDAALATLDQRLAAAAAAEGLRVEGADDSRLGEERAPYTSDQATEATWLRSATVGRHIAELRRAALDQIA